MVDGTDPRDSGFVATEPESSETTTRRSVLGAVLLVVLALIVLMLLRCSGGGAGVTTTTETTQTAGGLTITYPAPPSDESTGVIVPNVVGRSEADARAMIAVASLSANSTWEATGAPYGTVVHQFPNGGVAVDEGTLVDLTLSTGLAGSSTSVDTAPEILGLSLSEAKEKLASQGWSADITYAPSTSVDRGQVFYQRPGAGERTGGTRQMVVWISTGAPSGGYPYARPEFPYQ